MDLNIDERVAARAEGERRPHKVTIRGRTFDAVPSLPWTLAKAAMGDDSGIAGPDQLGKVVFGDEQWAEIEALVDVDEMSELLRALPQLYGYGPGESEASTPPSASTGRASRRTSSGSTASTSRKRAGAKTPSRRAASKR